LAFDGVDLLSATEREWQNIRGRRIGMIFQEPMTSLNPVQKIGAQVAETLRIHKLANKRQAAERAIQALAAVGIPEPARVAAQYPHQLSGGMRQRAMIATATIAEPSLLIADEPTTALDVTIAAQIIELLRALQRRTGMAMLFITHDLGLVADIADRVAVMYAGQIVETGPVAEVFARPLHPYTKGLLASAPTGRRDQRLQTIGGSVPSAHNRPAGCRFQPRCSFATAECLAPPSNQAVGVRLVRCFNHQSLAAAS
jgi:oligopeptide/dipeptide ABC transporter ATP-binding protein